MLPKIHSLRFTDADKSCHIPLDALAQCHALRVLELGIRVSLTSGGTPEETLRTLEESSLELMIFQTLSPADKCGVCTPYSRRRCQ